MARLVLVVRRQPQPSRFIIDRLDARIRKRWVVAAFFFGFAVAAVLMENQ